MATTPRPFLWQSLQLRADEADGCGGIAHYFSEDAQSLYLHDGIATKKLDVESGHWQELVSGEEVNISDVGYTQMAWNHPATGSLYGTAVLPDDDSTILYLLRYTYVKDIGNLITSGNYKAQVDNPVIQINAEVKNYDTDAFVKNETLFIPGAKITLGLMLGDSPVYKLCEAYLDQIDFAYNQPTVSISARNRMGVMISDPTIDDQGKKTDTVTNLCKWVLDTLGVDRYLIEENSTRLTLEYRPSDTGIKILQTIADMASGYEPGSDWGIEEMPDGTIVIGFNGFRGFYLPKSVFKFNGRSDLFRRSFTKSADGAYTKVYCTGKTSGGVELTPVVQNVTQWKYWSLPINKTYFAPTLENTTQTELANYALTLAKQLKRAGLHENYNTTIKPQLLVGDYATVQENGSSKDIGIINEITHTFGEKGFFTDFVADSGGDKQTLLTRSASDEKVYTSARRNGGLNRNRRLLDFIKNTAADVVRVSGGGGGGGGGTSGVGDVWVDGTSVVDEGIAKINLTGKQNVLTPGDRINIDDDTISASIAPFSIVNGEVCITYKEEVE